ncbi:MAG: secondary thiamine-phosphate synthase enzyme YjbQ [Candidatus Geothermarchaeales archaeon]
MKIHSFDLSFSTSREGDTVDLTRRIEEAVSRSGVKNGVVHIFAPHATGALVLTEYEPSLLRDAWEMLEELVPSQKRYRHPVNARSHLRSMILGPSVTVPVAKGELALGTWQSILWIEVDTRPRSRRLTLRVIGE